MSSLIGWNLAQPQSLVTRCWWHKASQGMILIKCLEYRQVSNIGRALVGNWIVDHSDVVGASPVGAAPSLQLHLPSPLDTWLQYIAQRQLQAETGNI